MQIQTVGLWEPPPNWVNHNLSKQQTFRDATTGFPANLRLRNEHRNSILMTPHYLDIGRAFDWLKQISHAARPIRNTSQIWVVTRHQYGISAFISQTSFRGETSGGVAKCRLFSPATWNNKIITQNMTFYEGIINEANTKGSTDRQSWRRLKGRNCCFWKRVRLTNFQNSFLKFVTFDMICLGDNFVWHEAMILSLASNFKFHGE